MKKFLILSLAFIFYCAPVFGQGGLIGLYLDTWGELCEIDDCDVGVSVLEVQVVHKLAPGAAASQFMIVASDGFTGTYLGEEIPETFAGIGNSRYGICIAYGECYDSPIHILTVRYLIYGTSKKNSYLEVVKDPDEHYFDTPAMVDCGDPGQMLPALGGRAYINGDGTFSCTTTPVETTTWGQIKALYRD